MIIEARNQCGVWLENGRHIKVKAGKRFELAGQENFDDYRWTKYHFMSLEGDYGFALNSNESNLCNDNWLNSYFRIIEE